MSPTTWNNVDSFNLLFDRTLLSVCCFSWWTLNPTVLKMTHAIYRWEGISVPIFVFPYCLKSFFACGNPLGKPERRFSWPGWLEIREGIQVFPQCISSVSFFCVVRLSSETWVFSGKKNTWMDMAQLDRQM